jgi:hypothetical protein
MDKQWITLKHGLFENLDCLRKLYFHFFNLTNWIGSKLWKHWDWQKETMLKSGHSTRFLWRKGRLVKGFRTSLHGRQYNVGTSEQSCSHFNWIVQSGVDDSLHCGAMILKVGVMHMFVKTRCTCSCGTVLMMNVSTTRLSTWWVSDFEGNHGQRKSMLGESHSHNQDT